MKIAEKFLLVLLLFLFPTQLAYHFWPSWSFVFGLRIDLLAPAIYLTDILVVSLIFLNLSIFKPFLKHFLILISFAIFNIVFSTSPLESLYRWIKILEFAGFAIYITKQKIVSKETLIRSLFYSSVVVSVIGMFQFIKSETLGGIFYFLGERSFNMATPGIALVSLFGAEHLRVYSTFSHPNSLAGYLGVVLILFLINKNKIFNNLVGILIIATCFVLTFSISAYLGILFAIIFYLFPKRGIFLVFILISLILPLVSPWLIKIYPSIGQNLSQRLDLSEISGQMISSHFLTGTGLGTFISNIPYYKGIYQPVHNIFLLVFAETGIVGLLAFCLGAYKLLKTKLIFVFIFIIFTGLTDHYWLTLQQNQLLLSLLIGLSFRYDMQDAK